MKTRKYSVSYAELVAIIGVIVAVALLILPGLGRSGPRPDAACISHLKELGVAIRAFSEEHDGRFPTRFVDYLNPYDPQKGLWSEMNYLELWPEYIKDLGIVVCPLTRSPLPEDWNQAQSGYAFPATSGFRRGMHPSWADDPIETPAWAIARRMREMGIGQAQADLMCRDNTEGNDQYCYPRFPTRPYVYWGRAIQGATVATKDDMIEMGKVVDNDEDLKSTSGNTGCTVGNRLEDIAVVLPDFGPCTLHYLRQGVEKLLGADPLNEAEVQSLRAATVLLYDPAELTEVPPDNNPDAADSLKMWMHGENLANLLFMDGHVETVQAPQENGGRYWMLSSNGITSGQSWWP